MTPLHTLLISLQRSKSRRLNAIGALEKIPLLDWHILEGVDGSLFQTLPFEYNESKVIRLLGFPLTPAEIGCFLSHRQAWIQCIDRDEPTLILEDDFSISPNFEQAISALIIRHQDWDIARLQGLENSAHTTLISESGYQIVVNHEDPLGATGYIIKPHAAKKLVQCSKEVYEPLDHFLEHYSKHNQKIVALKPYPIKAGGFDTTIDDRPLRKPIGGLRKKWRSLNRAIDRIISASPWFPN